MRFIYRRIPGNTVCKCIDRIVGAGITVNQDTVEAHVSSMCQHILPPLPLHCCISHDKTEHGCLRRPHIGAYHAGPLCHAGNGHGFSVKVNLFEGGLAHCISGENGVRDICET